MGDVGVKRAEEAEEEVVVVEVEDDEEGRRENGSEAVRWERLLPTMVLRVLLVETDDSTRQIIAALLRKCNYQVTAISDGLKAWEFLKQRRSSIDLILTELDLPSISGYALLSLIMEHDGCKNIPVIIMSSQDSISMVLKCMLKGATDFLIKPVRRNELKNLWRHVWRRLAMNVHSPQYLIDRQCQAEAAFENHAATCHSSDNVSSNPENNVVSKRATNAQDLSQMNHMAGAGLCHKTKKNIKLEELTQYASDSEQKAARLASERRHPYNEASVSAALCEAEDGMYTGVATEDGIVRSDSHRHRNNNIDDHELPEPSCQARNLIGRINKQRCTMGQSGFIRGLSNHNSSPVLELSLRRSDDPEIKEVDERHILNHSSASAFSWYNNTKKFKDIFPPPVGYLTQIRGVADTSAWPKEFSCSGENELNILAAQAAHGETASPDPQPGPARLPGTMFDGDIQTRCDYMLKPVCSPPTGLGAISPTSAFQREESPFQGTHSYTQECVTLGETVDHFSGQALHEPENSESVEKHGCNNSLVNPIDSSTPSNDFASHSEVTDTDPTSASDMVSTSPGEESVRDNCGNTVDQFQPKMGHHSAQREAALAKFRLKRKDRCYEKKVRYQSRKRLAELRPRVKGQFVRQAPTDQILADVDIL